jgi:hypothetical protein
VISWDSFDLFEEFCRFVRQPAATMARFPETTEGKMILREKKMSGREALLKGKAQYS